MKTAAVEPADSMRCCDTNACVITLSAPGMLVLSSLG